MNIQFDRIAVIGQLALDLLSNNLSGAEIGFIASKIFIIEKNSEVQYTKEELLDILTVFKTVYLKGIGAMEMQKIDEHVLMTGFLLDLWLSEFHILNTKASRNLGGDDE